MKQIAVKVANLYENNMDSPNVEDLLTNYLVSEVITDLREKNITNFGEWLKYYSQDGRFDEVYAYGNSYFYKAQLDQPDAISMEEKVLVYNAIALYMIEMDVEMPTGDILIQIVHTFLHVIRKYNLVLQGYLLAKGEILISDKSQFHFVSAWSHHDEPITSE